MIAPLLYRRRFIPQETIHLKDDEIIKHTNDIIITRWKTLKPKKEFSHGCSCVFLNEGVKVSKYYNNSDFLYYYCDIVDPVFSEEDNAYYINDLLVDVIVMPDGFVKVLDVDELTDALDQNLITYDMLRKALNRLDKLLQLIYTGGFSSLSKYLDEIV